ncbi:MAG: GNAT family N-acetyltransferase [Candidatus Paracaedibacter sp.]
MLFLEPIFAKTKVFTTNIQEIISKTYLIFSHFLKRFLSLAQRFYTFLNMVVSKTYNFISLTAHTAAEITLLTVNKIDALYQYTHRKIYVWKILSARHKWYQGRKGNLYNPKLNATISPSWVCTWNLSRFDDHYTSLESKEYAQDIAFKMWMKKRLLQKRLKSHALETRIAINFTEKIRSNSKILSNKIHLRDAELNDISELLTLIEQSSYSENIGLMQSQIQVYLNEKHHHILVALRGKRIVGFIAFVIYDLFISEGKRCRIEGLIVDKNQTDLSIKKKLMQAAETSARENNGKVIDLIDGFCRTNDGTHDFYRFLGYNNEGSMAKVYLRKEL